MFHLDTLQSGHQACDPNMNPRLLLHPSLFTHLHPVPDGYGSVPPTQNSQQSQPPVGGVQGQETSTFHSTDLTLSLLPDHAPLQLSSLPFLLSPRPLRPLPQFRSPDLEGCLSVIIFHILACSTIEEDPGTGLLQRTGVVQEGREGIVS